MKNSILVLFLTILISTSAFARSTGCKEGNCENGFGKWIYTDKTTYEGEWVATQKHGQGTETWPNGYIYKGEGGPGGGGSGATASTPGGTGASGVNGTGGGAGGGGDGEGGEGGTGGSGGRGVVIVRVHI
ncbi:MAG: hypothetical protein ACON4L_00120 [Flavobacteriaceae bacterium]